MEIDAARSKRSIIYGAATVVAVSALMAPFFLGGVQAAAVLAHPAHTAHVKVKQPVEGQHAHPPSAYAAPSHSQTASPPKKHVFDLNQWLEEKATWKENYRSYKKPVTHGPKVYAPHPRNKSGSVTWPKRK